MTEVNNTLNNSSRIQNRVSVVIPAYNGAKFIRGTVDSVLSQTYEWIEVIVVDDGSTDSTKDAIADYIENYRIRYIYQENSGPGGARNAGIRASSGEYLAFLDNDDSWSEDKIEKQVRYLERSADAAAVFCDGKLSTNGERIHLDDSLPHAAMNYYTKLLGAPFIIYPSSLLIRSCVIQDIGLFDEEIIFGDDADFMLRAALRHNFGYIDECLFIKTVRPDNLTNTTYYLQKEYFMHLMFKKHRALCPANHRRLFNKRYSKLMYMSARKFMSAMQLVEGLKVFITAVKLSPLYLAKLPALLVRYFRFCVVKRIITVS